jgi:hypothetical protein
MVRVNLWAPALACLDNWINEIQNCVRNFRELYGISTEQSLAHLRLYEFNAYDAREIILNQFDKSEVNIVLICQADFDKSPHLLSVLKILIDIFDNELTSQLIICDTVRMIQVFDKDVQDYKLSLYSPTNLKLKASIIDFSEHNCFYDSYQPCGNCTNKLTVSLTHALLQNSLNQLRLKNQAKYCNKLSKQD